MGRFRSRNWVAAGVVASLLSLAHLTPGASPTAAERAGAWGPAPPTIAGAAAAVERDWFLPLVTKDYRYREGDRQRSDTSGIQIQNMDQSPAQVTIVYRHWAGSTLAVQRETIPVNQSRTFFGPSLAMPAGISGSARILSDQDIRVISNVVGSNPTVSASFNAVRARGWWFVPYHRRLPPEQYAAGNLSGLSSLIQVQNANELAAVTVTATFYGLDSAEPLALGRWQLNPGQRTDLALPDSLRNRAFEGSVVLRTGDATDALAVTTLYSWYDAGREAMRAMVAASAFDVLRNQIYFPLVMADNRGWTTPVVIQNGGLESDTIQLQLAGRKVDEVTLGPGQARIWNTVPGVAPGFVGSAVAVSTKGGGQNNVAGLVLETHPDSQQGMVYSGFGNGSASLVAPLLMTDNRGWSTGLQVQNIGKLPADLTLRVDGRVVANAQVGAGDSVTWYPIPGTSPGFVGAGIVESSGPPIVGLVNEIQPRSDGGDTSMAYEAFNAGR